MYFNNSFLKLNILSKFGCQSSEDIRVPDPLVVLAYEEIYKQGQLC